jgi:hypothetical protein
MKYRLLHSFLIVSAASALKILVGCSSNATMPSDAGTTPSDAGETANEAGEGSDDASGGPEDSSDEDACSKLNGCCINLPDPAARRCQKIVRSGSSIECSNSTRYCELDPAACAKLTSCCTKLDESDRVTCQGQVSFYEGDVELCAGALSNWGDKCQ